MKIEIEKVREMIQGSEYLEDDERHTPEFKSGVKVAHINLKSLLADYEEGSKEAKE